jgi:hypothetical protein
MDTIKIKENKILDIRRLRHSKKLNSQAVDFFGLMGRLFVTVINMISKSRDFRLYGRNI